MRVVSACNAGCAWLVNTGTTCYCMQLHVNNCFCFFFLYEIVRKRTVFSALISKSVSQLNKATRSGGKVWLMCSCAFGNMPMCLMMMMIICLCVWMCVCSCGAYFCVNQSSDDEGVLHTLCSSHWSCPRQKIITVSSGEGDGQHRKQSRFTASEDESKWRRRCGGRCWWVGWVGDRKRRDKSKRWYH